MGNNNAVQWIWYAFFIVGSLGGCVFLFAVVREGLKSTRLPLPRRELPMAPRVRPAAEAKEDDT